MLKLPKYLFGVVAGASIVAFPVAFLWLYMATGRIPLPFLSEGGLISIAAATDRLEWLTRQIAEASSD